VRTGLSDGKFSEVLEGELQAGETIVIGLATSRAGGTSSSSPLAPSGPGGRRF